MCGQYFFDDDPLAMDLKELLAQLRARVNTTSLGDELIAYGRVCPSDAVAAFAGETALPMQWGFHLPDQRLLINARSETAAQKAMFAAPLKTGRCILPASHFFEWQHMGKERVRYECRLEQGKPMYLAGLYRFEPQRSLPVFVILTRAAEGSMAEIHDRMPVIVPQEGLRTWLCDDVHAPQIFTAPAPRLVLRAG